MSYPREVTGSRPRITSFNIYGRGHCLVNIIAFDQPEAAARFSETGGNQSNDYVRRVGDRYAIWLRSWGFASLQAKEILDIFESAMIGVLGPEQSEPPSVPKGGENNVDYQDDLAAQPPVPPVSDDTTDLGVVSVEDTTIKDYELTGEIPPAITALGSLATAGITLLGAGLMMLGTGVTPREVFDGVRDWVSGGRAAAEPPPPPIPDASARSPEDILADPRLGEHLTDTGGKEWVYSRRPGDAAGDGWVSAEEHRQTVTQEAQGRVWSDRWGWTTREEARGYEANLERQREADRLEAQARLAEEVRLKEQAKAQREALAAEKARLRDEEAALAREKIAAGEAGYRSAMEDVRSYDRLYHGAKFTVKACDTAIDKMADAMNLGSPVGPGTKAKLLYRSLRNAGGEMAKVFATGKGSYEKAFLKGAGTAAYDTLADIAKNKLKITGQSDKLHQLAFNVYKWSGKEFLFSDGRYEVPLTEGILDTAVDPGSDTLLRGIARTFYRYAKDTAATAYRDARKGP